MPIRLLHVSDLHFGRYSVAAQVDGVERLFSSERFDAIVVSGDLSQRTRTKEFERARKFLIDAQSHAPVLVVPGNHDTAWWMAPMGIGSVESMYARYRKFVCDDLEPVLHVPGATLVGLNSAQGIRTFTLTTRLRDPSVVGALRDEQLTKAMGEFEAAPRGDVKVLVFHHNLLRGGISHRWGLSSRARGITGALTTGADVVLCGHDHQAAVECLDVDGKRLVVSCASTLTTRVRGRGPGSINILEVDDSAIQANVMQWSEAAKTFERKMWYRFAR